MLGTLLLVREPYLELNPDVAWIARWKFGGCLDPFFFVGHLGSVPGFEARLGLDSVIPNLETVFFSSLRGSSGDLPDVCQLL